MKDIFEILKNNWQPIVAVLVLILSFILQLIKKKPINEIFSTLYELCIQAINDAEDVQYVNYDGQNYKVSGEDKLSRAVNYVKSSLMKLYPNINTAVYTETIKLIIEDILTTPQKKGGSTDGK